MPAVIPFIPLIAQGAGMLGGAIAGKKATKAAQQRSPEEMQALTGAQGAADSLGKQGGDFLQQSKPWMQQPANFYQTLLSGNRAAMSNAVAAPMAQISQQFRGAERGLDRSGIRGAARDVAAGELGRDRVSKMAGLTTGVQGAAAEGLAGLGTTSAQLGAGMAGQGGSIYANLLNQGATNRQYARQEGGQTAGAIGNLAATAGNVLTGIYGNKSPTIKTAPIPQQTRTTPFPPLTPSTMRAPGIPSYVGDAYKANDPWARA
jgi:hypothetical protein